MKSITLSVMDSETTMNLLRTEKSLLMNANEEPGSCLFQTGTSGAQITLKLRQYIAPVYLGFVFNFEKSFSRYCSRKVFELIQLNLELRGKRGYKSEEVTAVSVPREYSTIFGI